MKIAVLSDTRVPTLPTGGHGLGRFAHRLATYLQKQGHNVTLYAGAGSKFDGKLVMDSSELQRAGILRQGEADVFLDMSHDHDLSRIHPDWAVLNYVVDAEVRYQPPNAAVVLHAQEKYHPNGRYIPMGFEVGDYPIYAVKKDYLAYAAKVIVHKGYHVALEVHQSQEIPVRFVGERFVNDPLPSWKPELHGKEFETFVGEAKGLLYPGLPVKGFGAGAVQIEAALMGTPCLCLDNSSAVEWVEHGVSGYICRDAEEMADAVQDLGLLNAHQMREWAVASFGIEHTLDVLEDMLQAVVDGERW